jgi:hypothetical protein
MWFLPDMDDVVRDGAVMCVLGWGPRQIHIPGREAHYKRPTWRIRYICKERHIKWNLLLRDFITVSYKWLSTRPENLSPTDEFRFKKAHYFWINILYVAQLLCIFKHISSTIFLSIWCFTLLKNLMFNKLHSYINTLYTIQEYLAVHLNIHFCYS